MSNIVKNELVKLFARKKIYVFMGILLVITLVTGIAVYSMIHTPMPNKAAGQSIVKLSGQVFPITILDSIGNIIAIFIVILITDMLTEEYTSGTLKLSLMRPVTRGQLLAGKMLALFLAVTSLLVFTMVTSYIVGIAALGWGENYVYGHVTLSPLHGVLATVGSYLLSVLPVYAFGMITLLLSILLTSGGSVIGISIAALFGQSIISQIYASIRPYLVLTYFQLHGFAFEKDWATFPTGIAVSVIYGAVFYAISHYVFKRKDLLN